MNRNETERGLFKEAMSHAERCRLSIEKSKDYTERSLLLDEYGTWIRKAISALIQSKKKKYEE